MKILIVGQFQNPKVVEAMNVARAYLNSQHVEHVVLNTEKLPDASFVYSGKRPESIDPFLEPPFDMGITLGGDGTLLHASRLTTMFDIPVLGINFGHLGFLANSNEGGVVPVIQAALAGDVDNVKRTNLRIDVVCERPDGQPNEPDAYLHPESGNVHSFYALNEVAIARGALGQVIDSDLVISGDQVVSLRGDGVVVSTATGSTAYALSAGGPLVAPHFRGMVVVPLAPHTLNSRAIITEEHDIVEVQLPMRGNQREVVSLFVDGDPLQFDAPVERVVVRTGAVRTRLMKYRMDSFYKQISRTFFNGMAPVR